jgi:DNA-binding CsgD family transcriptional regulator
MRDRIIITGALAVQATCTFFFVSDILSSYIGISRKPIAWEFREVIEIGAAVGLLLGFVLGALALVRSRHLQKTAEARLKIASAAFMDVIEDAFAEWGLTPAERDVALFAIKGLSTQDIASLRETSEGTVKAQTAAIYRKAGVSGRSQLLSLFIDGLMDGDLFEAARVAPPAAVRAVAVPATAGEPEAAAEAGA